MPCSAQSSASSPPRPNTNGSPPLSRTTALPACAWPTSSSFGLVLRDLLAAAALADVDDLGAGAGEVERLARDQLVVEHDVGLASASPRGA